MFCSLVLTAQILWKRTGRAIEWNLLTTRETLLFFGKQPDRTFRNSEWTWLQEEIPQLIILHQISAQSWCSKTFSSFPAESLCKRINSLWFILGSNMNCRLKLDTQVSKYTWYKLHSRWEIWLSNFHHNLNFKGYNNAPKWSLTGVTNASQNRFRRDSSTMKIAGGPPSKVAWCLLLPHLYSSYIFTTRISMSRTSLDYTSPLCDLEKSLHNPSLGRSSLCFKK